MMRQAKGFTIIELMIVIAVLGILSAIAIPNYMDYLPKSRVNAAARDVPTQGDTTPERPFLLSERWWSWYRIPS